MLEREPAPREGATDVRSRAQQPRAAVGPVRVLPFSSIGRSFSSHDSDLLSSSALGAGGSPSSSSRRFLFSRARVTASSIESQAASRVGSDERRIAAFYRAARVRGARQRAAFIGAGNIVALSLRARSNDPKTDWQSSRASIAPSSTRSRCRWDKRERSNCGGRCPSATGGKQ